MDISNENLIIHFTSSFENLTSIIKTASFRITYSKEDFKIGKLRISSAAHPMVCFSEQKIIELSNRVITYGKYGIGFTKEWARKKKLSPVIYISEYSMAAKGLAKLLRARQNQEKSNLPDSLRLPIMQLKCFTKNEKGYNSHLKINSFDFKQENEWRYIPEKKDIGNGLISQNKSRFLKNPDYYNNKLLKYPFRFNIKDIKVIFVENSNEIDKLVNRYKIERNKIRIFNWKTEYKKANAQSSRPPRQIN